MQKARKTESNEGSRATGEEESKAQEGKQNKDERGQNAWRGF